MCGKGLADEGEFQVELINGGADFGREGLDEEETPRHRGYFPVCKPCTKKYRDHFVSLGYKV